MKEEYLHTLWRLKRLPFSELKLSDGKEFKLLNTGWHNHDAGPDFFNGSVEIDGIIWHGNIEIHINSSDWYAHKHQHDSAYNNVILHVVLNNDKDVSIDGKKIPCLELKEHIDQNHLKKYENLTNKNTWIPCENLIQKVPAEIITNQVENSLVDRLLRKNKLIEANFKRLNQNPLHLIYETYASAFGLKVNALPMIELCKTVDVLTLWKHTQEQAEILLLGAAGILNQTKIFEEKKLIDTWNYHKLKNNFSEMEVSSWKFKGLRPVSFPQHKIKQFVKLCFEKDFFRIHELSLTEIQNLLNKLNFPTDFRNNILINAIIPLIWWKFEKENQNELKDLALNLLLKIPPENNSILENWKKLDISFKSSFETQGLLELKNELCTDKKCLSCKIGYSILKQ
jgi:hypothetical protein